MCQPLSVLSIVAVLAVLLFPSAVAMSLPDPWDIAPQQVHIALGYTPTTIFVQLADIRRADLSSPPVRHRACSAET